ncbi:Peptidyl-prolyl cis-trans isomerase CWC27 like protein [Eufriesea mexicana]|uniref:Peptidyl-prolyl cis-trans isomerase CWC27 like protein n=1 Tax=Eufriesea mexicana TaxID=516756 RepID=A0A310SRV5_9HYME|nr:Peptidyl-prolyl cis-trans isomerase CWC27 like protein [Eufriesea mexicana]
MKTTVGDVELELWAKEIPKASQGGDSTGTGEGGKIYGEPLKDEFHTRLRFCRRDLIAMVNANDRPLYPPRLIKTIILNNPFSDIIPRIIVQEKFSPDSIVLYNEKLCYRDLNLLSFGGEAKEDEEESVILNKKFTGKGKSAHDHLTDPKLSSQTAVEPSGLANKKRKEGRSSDWESDAEVKTQEELEVVKKEKEVMKKRIKNTLRDTKKEPRKVQNYKIGDAEDDKNIKENE